MSTVQIVSLGPPVETRRTASVWLDEFGLLHVATHWVALSETQWRLMDPLVAKFGTVVSSADLNAAVWPTRPVRAGALNVLVQRTRPRLDVVGLTVVTVRSRGFFVDFADSDVAAPGVHDRGSSAHVQSNGQEGFVQVRRSESTFAVRVVTRQ